MTCFVFQINYLGVELGFGSDAFCWKWFCTNIFKHLWWKASARKDLCTRFWKSVMSWNTEADGLSSTVTPSSLCILKAPHGLGLLRSVDKTPFWFIIFQGEELGLGVKWKPGPFIESLMFNIDRVNLILVNLGSDYFLSLMYDTFIY